MVKRSGTETLCTRLCGRPFRGGGLSVSAGGICGDDSARGCICRLGSGECVRAIFVGQQSNKAIYMDARINYSINYVFYRSKHGNFIHGLAPSRVIRRIVLVHRGMGHVIFVKVKRPLFGCSGLVTTVRVLQSEGKLGFPASNVAMSAINPIGRLGGLHRRRLGVRLAVSLRTTARTTEGYVVPRVRVCTVRSIIGRTLSCSRERGQGIMFTCLLLPNVGSHSSSVERLTG